MKTKKWVAFATTIFGCLFFMGCITESNNSEIPEPDTIYVYETDTVTIYEPYIINQSLQNRDDIFGVWENIHGDWLANMIISESFDSTTNFFADGIIESNNLESGLDITFDFKIISIENGIATIDRGGSNNLRWIISIDNDGLWIEEIGDDFFGETGALLFEPR